jgi:hypothetical protein
VDPTGLVNLGARHYDPERGVFLSPDPMGHAASVSLYDYANGDPVNNLDPDGRFGKQAYSSISSGVSTAYSYGAQSFNLGVANASTGLIPASMGLGTIGTGANSFGSNPVGNFFNDASRNTLQFTADRWTAANQGPMGRVWDNQVYAVTSSVGKAVIGERNAQFFGDWLTGNAPTSISYGQNSVQARDMQTSPGVQNIRNFFYAKNAQTQTGLDYGTIRAYAETIADPRTANWHSISMQVGGFGEASISNNNDGTATYNMRNVAGANSFFLHVVPNLRGTTGPMHNVEQLFSWTESIDQEKLRK